MKIVPTHSVEADTAYVAFGDEREVAETIAPLEDLAIDLDAEGRIVGIEFVTASRLLDRTALQDAEADELIGVTEIAQLIGKHKQNVAQHYTRRPDFPPPTAELPTGRYWRRGEVEAWWERSDVGKKRRDEAITLAAAAEWLTHALALSEHPVPDLQTNANAEGIGWAAVEDAAHAIGVERHRSKGRVVWALPADHPARRRGS